MNELGQLGRSLIVVGLLLAGLGAILMVSDKFGGLGWVGRLPGDIYVEGDGYSFYFPFTTCVILSLILSFFMYLFGRL